MCIAEANGERKKVLLQLMNEVYKTYYKSPMGGIEICASEKGLLSVSFIDKEESKSKKNTILSKCIVQLKEYFSGNRKEFDIPLDMLGTEFQKQVWCELQNIPFGKTVSYLDIAKKVGDKNSTRAVGNANGKNPVAIIIPCHRVIGMSGKLVGYAGGIERKRWLLNFENNITSPNLFN